MRRPPRFLIPHSLPSVFYFLTIQQNIQPTVSEKLLFDPLPDNVLRKLPFAENCRIRLHNYFRSILLTSRFNTTINGKNVLDLIYRIYVGVFSHINHRICTHRFPPLPKNQPLISSGDSYPLHGYDIMGRIQLPVRQTPHSTYRAIKLETP